MLEIFEKKRNLSFKLAECVLACNYCFNKCLDEDDVKMMKECIKLDKECASICQFTLGMLYKNAHFMKAALDLCEKACEACGDECRKHNYDHCQQCAKACDECAKACREFMQYS